MSTDLAFRNSIPALCRAFAQAEADVRQAFALIVGAESSLNATFAPGATCRTFYVDATTHGSTDNFENVERAVMRLRRRAWSLIVDRLELRRMLSIKRREEMETFLDTGDLPTLTEATVHAFIDQRVAELPAMIEEAIVEVFHWLRPPAGSYREQHYKTNQKNARFELGSRVILTGLVHRKDGGGYGVDWQDSARLTALENIFSAMDGKGMVTKGFRSDLENALAASGREGVGATPYFGFRACRNHALHLHFKRLDLLAQLNRRAGGKALKPDGA